MSQRLVRLLPLAVLAGAVLLGIFSTMVVRYRTALRAEVRQTIINRDAAVLLPMALRQLAQSRNDHKANTTAELLIALLDTAQQKNMLAVVIFDAQGRPLRYAPDSLVFAELPLEVYAQLLKFEPISRYHSNFPLARYFAGIKSTDAAAAEAPVLEVLLPLSGGTPVHAFGFAQYYIDARPLANELALIDERMSRLTSATLGIGAALISLVVALAYFLLRRAQFAIAERNARLMRTNFELTLAIKASALGQITSHLIHGLQGSVAGLRAVVTGHRHSLDAGADWASAANYTERMQELIQETVSLLGDAHAHTSYELTGHELTAIIRERNCASAAKKGVTFSVSGGFENGVESHRGGLLCLIASNLIQNAIEATPAERSVTVNFRNENEGAILQISDQGHGFSTEQRAHLFEPGRSARPGGSGLGLAISQLLARQIGATLTLHATGPNGTIFILTLPLGPITAAGGI